MLALLHDLAGELVAVHRTFLAPGGAGKASVEPQRMTLGDVRGAAVRLYPAAPHLAPGGNVFVKRHCDSKPLYCGGPSFCPGTA